MVWVTRGGRRFVAAAELGQSLVEFALALPFFFFALLVAIQLAVFVGEYYNLMQVTRETARWVAINPDTTDSTVLDYSRSLARPGMLATRFVSVTTTPPCPTLDAQGHCSARVEASPLSVELKYDVSHAIFLPTKFQLGRITASIPSDLPSYRVSVTIE